MSLLVFLCLFWQDSVVVKAANPDSLTSLIVDGVVLNVSGDEAKLVGEETQPRWRLENGVLTLNGYDGGQISANGDLAIILETGTQNTITTSGTDGIAISSSETGEGILTLSGSGTLTVNSTSADSSVSAISAKGGMLVTNTTLILSASSFGTTVSNGYARALFSESGYISIFTSNVTAASNGAYGYTVNTGGSAISNDISIDNSTIQITSNGTVSDTALRVSSVDGDVSIKSSTVTLNGDICILGRNIELNETEFTANGVNGGLNARAGVSIIGGTTKIVATSGTSSDVRGVRCEGGNFSVSGENAKVYIEAKHYGISSTNDLVMDGGKVQILASGTASRGSYIEGNVYVNGGTLLTVGRNAGLVTLKQGEVKSHGVDVEEIKLTKQTVYFAEDGTVFGGDRQLIRVEDEIYCQFEIVDNLATAGWRLEFDSANSAFLLTLDNYIGKEIYAYNNLRILTASGSDNTITTSTTSPAIYVENYLYITGNGYLEVVGASHQDARAIYVRNGITLDGANLYARAQGCGIECFNGGIDIFGGRVASSGRQYTIFSNKEFKIGENAYNEEHFSAAGIFFNDGTTLIKANEIVSDDITGLKVDGAIVEIDTFASGDGWTWYSALHYLLLNNYNGGYIYGVGNLDIELEQNSENIIKNIGSGTETLSNLISYVGIAATQKLQIFGKGSLDIEVTGKTGQNVAYGMYAYNTLVLGGVALTIDTSGDGIVSKASTVSMKEVTFNLNALGNGITASGDITIADCDIDLLSYKIALYSVSARILFDGGNAQVYGGLRSAVANMNMFVDKVAFVTGALSNASGSVLYTAFVIEEGVFVSTFEKAIFKINGQYFDYEGEAIDRLETDGWKFDYDAVNSKYILQLKNYVGGSIKFSLNLEVQLLDDSDNTVVYTDNIDVGETYSCFDIGGSLTIIGSGKLKLGASGEDLGGIGVYALGGCTINGDNLSIDATRVARGFAIGKSLIVRDCTYRGNYITANSVYIYGGDIRVDSAKTATHCFSVTSMFYMSGGKLELKTNANSLMLACINSSGAVSILDGELLATATGEFGRAINAAQQIKLYSDKIVCFGEDRAIFSENEIITFGDSVLAFAGATEAVAQKTRALVDGDKFFKTQKFVFSPIDLLFDNDAPKETNKFSFDLGDNFAYFEVVKLEGISLKVGEHYTIDGTTVNFTNAFLTSLPNGVHRLEVHFGGGFYKTVSLTVENSKVSAPFMVAVDYLGALVVGCVSLLLIVAFVCSAVYEFRKVKNK